MEISFVRGDSFPFKFKIATTNNENIVISDIETLYITCRKKPSKTFPIIFQKKLSDLEITKGYCKGIINPIDTEELDYGEYYMDIELTLKNGYRKTKVYKINLTEETTIHKGGEDVGN